MNHLNELTTQQQRKLYELCWQFEEAWINGNREPIQQWVLRAEGIPSDVVFAELLATQEELEEQPRSSTRSISQQSSANHLDGRQESLLKGIPRFRDDRYEFVEEIDRGGAAVVWRVRDRHLERETAIKYLLDSQDNAEMRSRLEREARLCARLVHPGIVPIHELSSFADQRPFVSMKLVEGKTLQQLLNSNPQQNLRTLIEIFSKACQAMAFAHEKEIIHRDLKPSNIMVGLFGEVQIMDWGLAKDLSKATGNIDSEFVNPTPAGTNNHNSLGCYEETTSDARHSDATIVGSVFGTIAYMSPEQASGDICKIDKRADVFSLGAVLCRILTGAPPYQDVHQHALLSKAQNGELGPALQRLAKSRQRKLAALAAKCLSANPASRPKDAAALVKRLEEIQREEHLQRQAVWYSVLAILIGILAFGFRFRSSSTETTEPLTSNEQSVVSLGESLELPNLKSLLRSEQRSLLLNSYQAALDRFPKDTELLYLTAVTLLSNGRPENAERVALRLLEMEPENCEYHYLLGQSFYRQGKLEEAKFETLESIELWDPDTYSHLPLEAALAKITRCAEYIRQVDSQPTPTFDELDSDQILEVADACDLGRKVELAAHYYSLAFEREQDVFERSKNRQMQIRWFALRHLATDDLSTESRNTLCKVTIQWLRDQLDITLNPPDDPVSIQRSQQLMTLLKTGQDLSQLKELSKDKRLTAEIRADLTKLVHDIREAKTPP